MSEAGPQAPGASVSDNVAGGRFELPLPGGELAYVDYRREGEVYWLVHAQVPAQFEGRGVGSRLVQGTLELLRSRDQRAVPVCGFIVTWMRRHPEYDPLRAS